MQIIYQAANTDLKFLFCGISVQLDIYSEPSCLCSDGLLLTPIRVHLSQFVLCKTVSEFNYRPSTIVGLGCGELSHLFGIPIGEATCSWS